MRILPAAAAVLIAAGLPYKMDVSEYEIRSEKVKDRLVFCILSDLHCRRFGKNQKRITDIVNEKDPDCILIPGDLFDYERDHEISFELIRMLKGRPVFFSTGNHDIYLKNLTELKKRLKEEGVNIIDDRTVMFRDCEITGLRDRGFRKNLPDLSTDFTGFKVLLSHRPEYIRQYNEMEYDLIVSGHAHGGQWCIPFTKQGLFTPQQGFLPKYTHGMHDLKSGKLVISRGLASGHPYLPRLYNNPEIVFVEVVPEQF